MTTEKQKPEADLTPRQREEIKKKKPYAAMRERGKDRLETALFYVIGRAVESIGRDFTSKHYFSEMPDGEKDQHLP
jgi:hypothetical protein